MGIIGTTGGRTDIEGCSFMVRQNLMFQSRHNDIEGGSNKYCELRFSMIFGRDIGFWGGCLGIYSTGKDRKEGIKG